MKALLLIGGKSSRMNTDKHLLEIDGTSQYDRLHQLLTDTGLDVCVSCNLEQYKTLPKEHYKLVDQYDAIGPIGGLVAAINHRPEESWLIVACDLINLEPETISRLVSAVDTTYDIITYQKEGSKFLETTITIYQPPAFRNVLDAVESGLYSLQRVLKKSKVKTIAPSNPAELKNVNYPGDLS